MANLSVGSSGSDVLKLQQKLNTMGYGLAEDGVFGSATQAAVRDYQSKNGLSADGIVGVNTSNSLYGSVGSGVGTSVSGYSGGSGVSGGNGLSGLSADTKTNLAKYSAGYTPSDKVSQYEKYLNDLMAQKPGEYKSAWETQMSELYDRIMGRPEFSYDMAKDPLYQQYSQQYQRLGQQAMMNTVGQGAALTGGYANSYAQNVGQQAYQGYLQQLNDIVPELANQAYNRYRDQEQDLYNQYALAMNRDESDYGRYRDTLADYYNDYANALNRYSDERNFDYSDYANLLQYFQQMAAAENADYWNAQDLAYQRERAAAQDAQWAAEYALAQQKANSSGGGNNSVSNGGTAVNNYSIGSTQHTGTANNNNGNVTSLSYSPDEGIFVWAGNAYSSLNSLAADIEASNLSSSEKETLKKKFKQNGFSISF